MNAGVVDAAFGLLLKRASGEAEDPEGETDSSQKEVFASWALFISILLLIVAFTTSYILQQKRVQAVHETVISIFAGMTVGLFLRVSAGNSIRDLVSFDYQIFFNLLLPPIILNSGYELHQANFFRNIGSILTFAFGGTCISAIVIGVLLWLYTRLPFEAINLSFVDAMSVGATLSATDPVTILAIFTTYKVDPKLYTIIFGESILNDAIAIVIFETAQKISKGQSQSTGLLSLLEGIGIFLAVFFGSLVIGILIGVATALVLKYTYLRRYSKIEGCLIVLISYASYFFSQGLHMSGIVSLLFCGITLKHYAYFNMSRRTQLSTKYIFQVLAQLSENFIFIYLGLSLFTDPDLQFRPLLIIVTVGAVCVARWCAVFPLSWTINWVIRARAQRRGREVADELPYNYQAMLFWAGLRGAVGVALAALLTGENNFALKATVLVVVVLTVIIFGGTTSRMLEILGIRTNVVEELDSDDEFDIEAVGSSAGCYSRVGATSGGIGYNPRHSNTTLGLDLLRSSSPATGPSRTRKNSRHGRVKSHDIASPTAATAATAADLLGDSIRGSHTDSDYTSDPDVTDLPPMARRSSSRRTSRSPPPPTSATLLSSSSLLSPPSSQPLHGSLTPSQHRLSHPRRSPSSTTVATGYSPPGAPDVSLPSAAAPLRAMGSVGTAAAGALRTLFNADDHAALFRQLDEDFIKPHLLLSTPGSSGKGGLGLGFPGDEDRSHGGGGGNK